MSTQIWNLIKITFKKKKKININERKNFNTLLKTEFHFTIEQGKKANIKLEKHRLTKKLTHSLTNLGFSL